MQIVKLMEGDQPVSKQVRGFDVCFFEGELTKKLAGAIAMNLGIP